MKKKFAAAALCVAGLLTLSACTIQVKSNLSANWLSDPKDVYSSDFYEKLVYDVSFAPSETQTSGITVSIDDSSSFTMVTQAIGSFTSNNTTYSNVYRLSSTLTLGATYTYTDPQTAEKTEILSFGGTSGNAPAVIERTVWFRSTTSPDNLEPIRSENQIYSYSPSDSMNSPYVSVLSYGYTILYNADCTAATVRYTDDFQDLSEEERTVNDYTSKVSAGFVQSELTVEDLQKRYSCFDSAQLLFAARGLSYSSEAANSVAVVSGEMLLAELSLSCAQDSAEMTFSFTLDGQEQNAVRIDVAEVSFRYTNNGDNSGAAHTVLYALPDENKNPYYGMPLRITSPFGFMIGDLVYSLADASHSAPEQE